MTVMTSIGVWDDASQWQIHLRREEWPQRAGSRFIVAALDDVLATKWKLSVEDLILDFEELGGLRNGVAGLFHDALMNGSLVASAHPNQGGSPRPIPPTDWLPDIVDRTLATGKIVKRRNGRPDDMWVFVDAAELQLMLKVLSITDMLHQPDDRGPLEEMGELVFGNLAAIAAAARPPSAREAADRMLKLMLPSMKPTFTHDDLNSLVGYVATELRRMFEQIGDAVVDREFFELAIEKAYGEQVSGRTFEKAWRRATAWKDNKGKQPHKWRNLAGRKPAR